MPDHDTITNPPPNTVDGRPVANDATRVDGEAGTSEPAAAAGQGSAGEAMTSLERASDVDPRPSETDPPVAVDPVAPMADLGNDSMNPHSLNPHGAPGERYDADAERLGDRADGEALDGGADDGLDGRAETLDGRAETLDGRPDDRPVAEAPLTGSTMDADGATSTVDGRDWSPAADDATARPEQTARPEEDVNTRSEQAAAEKADLVGVASEGDEPAAPIVSSMPDPSVARDDRQGDQRPDSIRADERPDAVRADERPADERLIDAPVGDERTTQERPVDAAAVDERPVADRSTADESAADESAADESTVAQTAVDQTGTGSEGAVTR